jgi:hypothetical protein
MLSTNYILTIIWLLYQHFEPIEYVNSLFQSSLNFQANDPKIHIDVDDFQSFSKSMM